VAVELGPPQTRKRIRRLLSLAGAHRPPEAILPPACSTELGVCF